MTRKELAKNMLTDYKRNALWTIQDVQTPLTMKVTLEMAVIILEALLEEEQKTGYWIEHQYEACLNWEYSRYECSECHNWVEDDSDYCPNCGAKMRKARNKK